MTGECGQRTDSYTSSMEDFVAPSSVFSRTSPVSTRPTVAAKNMKTGKDPLHDA